MPNYFVMNGEGPYPSVSVRSGPTLPGGPWYRGAPLAISVPNPLDYTLAVAPPYVPEDDEDDDGVQPAKNPKVLLNAEAFPVMREDLLKVLLGAGVDNLETFQARLHDPINEIYHENYIAFNVIGLVAAADVGSSVLMPHAGSVSLLDTDFESLVVDSSLAKGLHLFRLAECCSAIIVNESIKDAVEISGIPGVVFYNPTEWSG